MAALTDIAKKGRTVDSHRPWPRTVIARDAWQLAVQHLVDAGATMHKVVTPDAGARDLVEDAIAYFQSADDLYRRGEYRFHPLAQTVASLGDHHAQAR